ncbi:hypothetical protein M9458_028148, partial [Cirrhinus mrigala]
RFETAASIPSALCHIQTSTHSETCSYPHWPAYPSQEGLQAKGYISHDACHPPVSRNQHAQPNTHTQDQRG